MSAPGVRWPPAGGIPRFLGPAPARGLLRATPEDFRVDESLAFPLTGEGGHLYLHVEKRGANTEWVVRQLARRAGVRAADLGYAGLKDRHAVTRQWVSLPPGAAGGAQDWQGLEGEGYRVLAAVPHPRKLRRGALAGNRFRIRLRQVEGDRAALEARLRTIARRGCPNWFGAQRFGRGGGNLAGAARLFAGEAGRVPRHLRGLWLSAARALLFNQVLAARVEAGNWDRALEGDVFQLAGSQSCFWGEVVDDTLRRRVAELDIHPTGPLRGRGTGHAAGACAALEETATAVPAGWREGLERAGLAAERRALRVLPRDLAWHWPDGSTLELSFALPRGSFATAVLDECLECREAGAPEPAAAVAP